MPDPDWRTLFYKLRDWCLDNGALMPDWAMDDIFTIAERVGGHIAPDSTLHLTTGHPPPAYPTEASAQAAETE